MDDSQMTLWVFLWMAQIAFSIFVLATEGGVAKKSAKLAKLKTHIVVMGFLPCGGLMLIPQVIEYAILKMTRAKVEAKQADLTAYLSSQGDFSDIGRSRPTPVPEQRNPFADDAPRDAPSAARDDNNPFL